MTELERIAIALEGHNARIDEQVERNAKNRKEALSLRADEIERYEKEHQAAMEQNERLIAQVDSVVERMKKFDTIVENLARRLRELESVTALPTE